MSMNPVIKAQWIADLRDPSRKQGVGHLRNAYGGQCCLDVLCEQAVKAGIIGEPKLNSEKETFFYEYQHEERTYREEEVLPPPVMDWAGLVEPDPSFSVPNSKYNPDEADPENPGYDVYGEPAYDEFTATDLNDVRQNTFSEIADILESSDI